MGRGQKGVKKKSRKYVRWVQSGVGPVYHLHELASWRMGK